MNSNNGVVARAVGSTSNIIQIFIEASGSPGNGETGLLFSTSSLIAYYKRNKDAAPVAITLVTATLGTFTSGGFKEISSSHMPGWYELHVPNAAFATGADEVIIGLHGAAGMLDCGVKVMLGTPLTDTERAAIFTQTLTESYAANNTAATPAQLLHMIFSASANFFISGTTLTCKKLDTSTTAMTFTLDSSTAPTSRLRAT